MKKNDLKKMALLGLSTGLLISSQMHAATNPPAAEKEKTEKATKEVDPNDGNLGYHLMTEEELLLELNPTGTALYNSLDAKGKELARQVASQRCNFTNACKGLNACATDKNKCAGLGDCKAKGKCALSDKNLAVKLVHDKLMKEKREKAAN